MIPRHGEHTDDEASDSDTTRCTGEEESSDDEQGVTGSIADEVLRSQCTDNARHEHQDKGNAHNRPTAISKQELIIVVLLVELTRQVHLLIGENAEDQRTQHITGEENDLDGTFQRHLITDHRPLEGEDRRSVDLRASLTSSTSVL